MFLLTVYALPMEIRKNMPLKNFTQLPARGAIHLVSLFMMIFLGVGFYAFEKYRAADSPQKAVGKKPITEEALFVSEPPVPLAPGLALPSIITPVIKAKKTAPKISASISLKEIKCASGETSSSCYDKFYREIVLVQSTDVAFGDLKKRYESDGFVKSECHQLTHTIGRTAVMKYPDISEAYAHGDSFCWSGYYHGVVEAFIQRVGKDNLVNEKGINDICRPLREKSLYSFDHYNCVHGIGHGLMYIHNNELFDSLNICDVITDSWERASCFGGVYMENIMADNKNHFTKYLKPEDPLYPCDAVDEQYKGQCYLMQTSYMLRVKGGDFSEVFSLCRSVPAPNDKICYQSLGRDASGQTMSDPERTKEKCLLGKDDIAETNCVIGAVKDFISYYHSDTQAKSFCAALPKNLSETCTSTANSYYQIF